jgi:hypothetical protein
MPIYVDEPFVMESRDPQAFAVGVKHGHRWSHLWCDIGEEEQLPAIAAAVGMRRAWFQDRPGFPHYDLVPPRRKQAIKAGAIERELADWIRERKGLPPLPKPIIKNGQQEFCL